MSPHSSRPFASWSLPDHLDLERLREAQAYLQGGQRHQPPSTADQQAWKWLYRTYDGLLRRWVVACHVPFDLVEDCLQEVWIDVMKRLPDFISDGTQRGLCSWLRSIAQSRARDLRRFQARQSVEPLYDQAAAELVGCEYDATSEEEQRARQQQVQRILAILRTRVSPRTFEAFCQHFVEGHSVVHIAAQLHEKSRQVSCRLYKAKQKFRLLYHQLVPKS